MTADGSRPMQVTEAVTGDGPPAWRNAPAGPVSMFALLFPVYVDVDQDRLDAIGDLFERTHRRLWTEMRALGFDDTEFDPLLVDPMHPDDDVTITLGPTCGCSGPLGWHCPGEESQHWTTDTAPDAECKHCGCDGVTLDA